MENDQNSGTNTVLIVIVLLIVVGALVWFFAQGNSSAPTTDEQSNETNKTEVEVTLPDMGGDEGDSTNNTDNQN